MHRVGAALLQKVFERAALGSAVPPIVAALILGAKTAFLYQGRPGKWLGVGMPLNSYQIPIELGPAETAGSAALAG